MKTYHFQTTLKEIWQKAVDLYSRGERDASKMFDETEMEFLRFIGATPAEVYDFVEDFLACGDPAWEVFLLVQAVRRDYFMHAQGRQHSKNVISEESLPAKTASVRDIEWLPRLIAKAKAKLRGEMPASIMYCCGGDRRFFTAHDIHPADFLRAVWAFENDDEALVDWVCRHSIKIAGESPLG